MLASTRLGPPAPPIDPRFLPATRAEIPCLPTRGLGDRPMIVCRRASFCIGLVAAVLAALVLVCTSSAADSPNGKTIAEVIPVGNRVRTPDQIRSMMHSRPEMRPTPVITLAEWTSPP